MDRTARSSLTVVAITAAIIAGGSVCGRLFSPAAAEERTEATSNADSSGPPPTPPFQGWGTPRLVLVVSGQQHGYLEPCGCTENQVGGLARRVDLFHQMWAKKWPTVAFDVGGTLNPERLSREQALLKFDFFRKAAQHMRYSAIALGEEELRLGAEKLFELYSNWSTEDDYDLQFLAANVTILSTKELGIPKDFRIVESAGLRIGVTAVVGKTKISPDVKEVDDAILKIVEPAAVLPRVIQEMKKARPHLMVLLAHANNEEATALAKQFPEFGVVVSAGGAEDPDQREQHVGNALFIQTGMKGKYTACIGLFGTGDRIESMKSELIELDRQRFENAPEMTELMREYQKEIVLRRPDHNVEFKFNRDATFVGVDQCKDCHTKAYEVWKKTAHSHGLESLTTGRADEKPEYVVDRQYDPECLACHVTGWDPQLAFRFKSGYVDRKTTPNLTDQQCENCHGPGSAHVELERAFAKDQKESPELTKRREEIGETRSCEDCHDHDNSPHFNYEKYWHGSPGLIAVEHSGTD